MSKIPTSRSGTVVAHYGVAVTVRFEDGERARIGLRRSQSVIVGDRVEYHGQRLSVRPGERVLRRRDSHGRVRAVASHLDCLGIVLAPVPESPLGFVDRGLVAARVAGIEPVILINKCELAGAERLLEEVTRGYDEVARIFAVSARTGAGLGAIRDWLAPDRRGVFIGTSGVGKSSLLNRLLPDLDLAVGEINMSSGLGRHVTSTVSLHRLPEGGELIDTPGFRDFGPVAVSSRDLAEYFPGFEESLQEGCRFRDCLHVSEPDCAVKEALERGEIPADRHVAYRSLLNDLQEQERSLRPH